MDELRARGVVLMTNVRGRYLGELPGRAARSTQRARRSRLRAPTEPAEQAAPGIPPFAIDFLADTTRVAYLLCRNDVRQRYPRIRFILSHTGGFLPYVAHRLVVALSEDTGRQPDEIVGELADYYFDTALSSAPQILAALLTFAQPERILFGSDLPFAPAPIARSFTARLDAYPAMTEAQRATIDHGNAAVLWGY